MKTMRKMALSAFAAALVAVSTPVWADPVSSQQQLAQAAPSAPSGANRFNRLMKAVGVEANAPQSTDGIHDPINPGTDALQPPREAFGELPKSNAGNRIDWVKSLQSGAITPRVDIADPNKVKQVMDLDIIREVKGSMPDVVYPHKQHTEWLDCAQCHPKIFVPKKGGNAISMAAILMGQYCGACHGKVAFPVSECTKCHSRPKASGSTPMRSDALTTPPQPVPVAAPAPAPVAVAAPAPVAAAAPAAASAKLTKDQLMKTGKAVYADNCSGCHGENGEGVEGTFPALKGSKIAKGPASGHVKTVVKGVADTAMQAWGESMSDEDIASVITFERNSWGNNMGDIVQPADVKAAR